MRRVSTSIRLGAGLLLLLASALGDPATAQEVPGPAGKAGVRVGSGGAATPVAGKPVVYRDEFGVPHIYAATEADGYYALGWAQAQDQLVPLLAMVVLGRGEQAAAYGPSGRPGDPGCAVVAVVLPCKDFVESDFMERLWRHAEAARAGFGRMSPQLQKDYRAWVAGVNHYMAGHPAEVPDWAPRLEEWDPVAISRMMLWLGYQVADGLADCRRGGAKLTALLDRALDRSPMLASNEWVLAPWRTADGAAILLSDPHGGVDGNALYEFRMDAGPVKVAGYSFGALPILVHNRRVGWGMTTGAPDVSDCYEVEVDPANPRRYRYDGAWKTMVTREETVRVKGGEPVTRTLEYTQHNGVLSPVVARAPGKAYVVSTSYMDQAGVFDEELHRMSLARSTAEVREAMKLLGMFPQNVMVADANGETWYVRAGRTPIRPEGYDWSRAVPGNTSATAWKGIHPLEDLVQIENPAAGYMQNDNISPDRMLEGSPATADRYPSYIFHDRPGRTNTRALRTIEVLSKAVHFTVDDAVALALDEKWYGTEAWQAALRKALRQKPELVRQKPEAYRRFLGDLLHFDGFAHASSVPAMEYYAWREALWTATPPVEALGDSLRGADPLPAATAHALLDGIDRAIERMHAAYGTTRLPLGEVFRIGRPEEHWPVGGASILPPHCRSPIKWDEECMVTVRAFTYLGEPDSLGHRFADVGSRILRLMVFTDPIQSFTLHNYGQSSRPDSPHYTDQARLTSERRLKPTWFERSALKGHIVSTTTLEAHVP